MKKLSEFIMNTDSGEVVKLYIPVVELEERIAELEQEVEKQKGFVKETTRNTNTQGE